MLLSRRGLSVASLFRLADIQTLLAREICSTSPCKEFRRGLDPVDRPDDAVAQARMQPDLVEQVMGERTLSQAEKVKQRLRDIAHEYQRFEGDTGSSEVQAASLTAKIAFMANHMDQHRKDYHSRRGLEAMLIRRRKLLQYLRRTDFDRYSALIVKLGLRDNYAKLDRLSARYSH
ncbi:hypothetical protein WJX73_002703 [Symbiochloris irregularis]|uniref:30S ribosomal protein S15 n=1 Tax=Symbiochloris irregularis TaxID=706552 RepID=A0AAW1NSQ8_9CHLO